MTNADISDLETRDYIFKIGDRGKGIQARYDENTDVLIFPRAAFDYVCELLNEALSQEPSDDAVSREAVLNEFYDVENLYERIKHLPSVNPQPCEDAISRQAVINAIENDCMKGGLGSCFACYNDAQAFRGEIEKLPSVTPQTECLKAQAKKQAMPMSCDDCCYEPNSPFCEMYRKDICETH